MVPTHVNAFVADLAEKKAAYAALGGEIATLEETIATMQAPVVEEVPAVEAVEEQISQLVIPDKAPKAPEVVAEETVVPEVEVPAEVVAIPLA